MPRILLSGWFSLDHGGATAGDLLARDVVAGWLDEAGLPYDVALGAPWSGGVHWRAVTPAGYTHLLLVCGPVGPDLAIADLVARFSACRIVAAGVSPAGAAGWPALDAVLARDAPGVDRPDLAHAAPVGAVPVVGRFAISTPQPEYPAARRDACEAAIDAALGARAAAVVPIDTLLETNAGGLRAPAEVDALVARMDVVVTTRLHGLVLALRHGVPAVAVDVVPGGAKVSAQARAAGWPHVLDADGATPERIGALVEACLAPQARALARACGERARQGALAQRDELLAALGA